MVTELAVETHREDAGMFGRLGIVGNGRGNCGYSWPICRCTMTRLHAHMYRQLLGALCYGPSNALKSSGQISNRNS